MDPVTHAVIGVAISKAFGNGVDISNPVSVGIVVGAVFPDIDIIFQRWGDYAYLKNHRGMTHSILGLLVSAVAITALLTFMFHSSNVLGIFLGTLMGCVSHTLVDLFNPYGAKLLWPFFSKKISANLLVVFDPILLGLLVSYIVVIEPWKIYFASVIIAYFFFRLLLKNTSKLKLEKTFGDRYNVAILPSMRKPFSWHFILEDEDYNIVGEKNSFNSKIRLIKSLRKIDSEELVSVKVSPVGRFFDEFTPYSHISLDKNGENTRYTFSDMRYYLRDDFVHHAVMEVDNEKSMVYSSFNPYSINRSNRIPLSKYM